MIPEIGLMPDKRKEVGDVGLVMNSLRSQCRSDKVSAIPMGSSGANLDY